MKKSGNPKGVARRPQPFKHAFCSEFVISIVPQPPFVKFDFQAITSGELGLNLPSTTTNVMTETTMITTKLIPYTTATKTGENCSLS